MQERGCFVFAFAGPQEVRELELGTDMASVNNLLGFLEKVRIPPHHVSLPVSIKASRPGGHLRCAASLAEMIS